jgi:hypothetical protein
MLRIVRPFAALAVAAAISLLSLAQAQAFCVTNTTEKYINVAEAKSAKGKLLSFYGLMTPGKELCCDWKKKDCNESLKEDGEITFFIYMMPDVSAATPGKCMPTIRADGRLVVEDTHDAANRLKCYQPEDHPKNGGAKK